MITALLPLLVAVGAFIFLREHISHANLAGFLLAVLGAVGLSLAGEADLHAPSPRLGNFFEFLAMLCAMGYTLILKFLSERYSAFLLTAMQAFVGALFFLPVAAFSAPLPTAISLTGLAAVVYLGVLITVGAYGLYNFAVSRLPASQASAFVNLIPFFTLLIAALTLGERLNVQQMLAAGLVFAGVALSQWRSPVKPVVAGVLD
jgi:drug/metabolite transporter (DMT)-like permease